MEPRTTTPLFAVLHSRRIQQKQFSAAVGIDNSRFNRICTGRLDPTPAEKELIAKHLNVSPSDLWDPYEHLSVDEAEIRRLVDFIQSPNGKLWVQMFKRVLSWA